MTLTKENNGRLQNTTRITIRAAQSLQFLIEEFSHGQITSQRMGDHISHTKTQAKLNTSHIKACMPICHLEREST
jgi:hypothetical protein